MNDSIKNVFILKIGTEWSCQNLGQIRPNLNVKYIVLNCPSVNKQELIDFHRGASLLARLVHMYP